jgi:hypothetical protein
VQALPANWASNKRYYDPKNNVFPIKEILVRYGTGKYKGKTKIDWHDDPYTGEKYAPSWVC